MAKYSVIIAAAGKAERFGPSEKKPFAKIDGRAVFLRSLELFISRPDVCQTILAVASDDLSMVKTTYGATLGFMRVQIVEGGERRCDTIANCLTSISEDAEFVAIHDAVRPCVPTERIDAVFAEAAKSGAAILACPIVSTLKRVSAAKVIDATLSRENLYEAQTPQVFRKSLLMDAYHRLSDSERSKITDDAQVLERLGHPVSVVECDASNLKITTKGDLTLAAAILKSRPSKPVARMGAFEEAQW